jgi:hypothetical protein
MLRVFRWLATTGALITITALAFGTFVQQLLGVEEFPITNLRSNLQPGNIPRSEMFNYFGGNPAEIGEFQPVWSLPDKLY